MVSNFKAFGSKISYNPIRFKKIKLL